MNLRSSQSNLPSGSGCWRFSNTGRNLITATSHQSLLVGRSLKYWNLLSRHVLPAPPSSTWTTALSESDYRVLWILSTPLHGLPKYMDSDSRLYRHCQRCSQYLDIRKAGMWTLLKTAKQAEPSEICSFLIHPSYRRF